MTNEQWMQLYLQAFNTLNEPRSINQAHWHIVWRGLVHYAATE